MSGVVLLATFGLSIYNAVDQSRANNAIEASSQAQQNSVIIANESLSTANQALVTANKSAEVAGEALQVAKLANNISATSANNQAVQDLFDIYQFCVDDPTATFTNGTTCQDILGNPLPDPTIETVQTSAANDSNSITNILHIGTGHKFEPPFLIVAVMTILMAIMDLLNVGLCSF